MIVPSERQGRWRKWIGGGWVQPRHSHWEENLSTFKHFQLNIRKNKAPPFLPKLAKSLLKTTSPCFPNFFCMCWCVLVPPMYRWSFALAECSRAKPCHSLWAQALLESPCTCCLVGGTRCYRHCRRGEKRKLFLLVCPTPLLCAVFTWQFLQAFSRAKGRELLSEKKWKFAKISNEFDDQRNSTVDHLQSFSFLLLLQVFYVRWPRVLHVLYVFIWEEWIRVSPKDVTCSRPGEEASQRLILSMDHV